MISANISKQELDSSIRTINDSILGSEYDSKYERKCQKDSVNYFKYKKSMSKGDSYTEDDPWVFDSLVCFLNSPIWNAPLQNFIEQKSLIFEPSDPNNEEYNKIFEEFKNLVDFMLGNFMEDIGITPEQFHEACLEGRKCGVAFNHSLFEQIWAANDYEMFIRMMTQKNVELQLQALELIENKYGIIPQSFKPKTREEEEKEHQSCKEKEHQVPIVTIEKEPESEKEVFEEVSKKFNEAIASTSKDEIEDLIERKPILEKHLLLSLEKPEISQTPLKIKDIESLKTKVEEKSSIIEIDPIELKKRQDYLRAQRDKLIALKKEVRQKQLTGEKVSKSIKNRPKSAKGAESILTGEKPNVDESQLQFRKALAEKLRNEVVEKSTK